MQNLIPLPYRILALVAAFALSNAVTAYRFYHTGYTLSEARHTAALVKAQADVAKAAEAASRREAERLVAQAEVDRLAQELEDAALHDPNAGRFSLGADSVRRINRR